jgi:hypothetical protein
MVKDDIKRVKQRLCYASRMQEGDAGPSESPDDLRTTLVSLHQRLRELIVLINKTNVETVAGAETLMELIADRDLHFALAAALDEVASYATPKSERFVRNEIRLVATVDVASFRKEADSHAKRGREIDSRIQACNWNTEVAMSMP